MEPRDYEPKHANPQEARHYAVKELLGKAPRLASLRNGRNGRDSLAGGLQIRMISDYVNTYLSNLVDATQPSADSNTERTVSLEVDTLYTPGFKKQLHDMFKLDEDEEEAEKMIKEIRKTAKVGILESLSPENTPVLLGLYPRKMAQKVSGTSLRLIDELHFELPTNIEGIFVDYVYAPLQEEPSLSLIVRPLK